MQIKKGDNSRAYIQQNNSNIFLLNEKIIRIEKKRTPYEFPPNVGEMLEQVLGKSKENNLYN